MTSYTLQFWLLALAGWINREQQDVIEYLREENRVYRERRGGCDSMTLSGAGWRAIQAYADHYHRERNRQGVGNRLIEPGPEAGSADGRVKCRESLGGLLRYYYREAG